MSLEPQFISQKTLQQDPKKHFVHLKCKSDYSLCRGALRIKEAVALAKANSMPAIAICDENLFGSLEFASEAVKNGIQPIVSCLVDFEFNSVVKKIIIIAKTEIGFQNLLILSNKTVIDKTWKHKVDMKHLIEFKKDLIIILPHRHGHLEHHLEQNNTGEVKNLIETLKKDFSGDDCGDLYLEIVRTKTKEEIELEPKILDIAIETNIPIVAGNDIYFAKRDDYEAADILRCIGEVRYQVEENRPRDSPECYFKTQEQMIELFDDLPEAVESTINIAKKCYF